nr:hypothetical protein [Tanacetum cinerariifolium]
MPLVAVDHREQPRLLGCEHGGGSVVLLLPWCCRWRRGCGGHGGVLVSAAGVADEAAAWIVVAVGGFGAVWRGDCGGGVCGGGSVVLLLPWYCRWRRGCGGHGGVLVSAAGVADEAAARRVRESDMMGRVDRVIRSNFVFAGKSPPEKFPGGGSVATVVAGR